MKFLDSVVFVVLVIFLFIGAYLLWLNFPTESREFESYVVNVSDDLLPQSSQFYPNMRYKEKEIGYMLGSACSAKRVRDFVRATEMLEEKTILEFKESSEPEIIVSCSNLAPEPEQEDHFIAGEGGPTEVINASEYAVIFSGEISLYRPGSCDSPQIALHEILHVLGFDHNNNPESIMYPVTDCDQEMDQYIVDEINSLYGVPSLGDILIESVNASKSGRYLSFEVVVANHGLQDVKDSSLVLSSNDKVIKLFEIGDVEVGARRHLTVSNLKVSRSVERISFVVETPQLEILKGNNFVEISIE